MHPEFAAAIDPIFREALQLFERIEGGEPCDAAVEHGRMLAIFDRAELALGQAPMWRLAKYALAVWIDEMLLTLSWSGVSWWRDHILEMELFQSRICNVHFYELANVASGLPSRDALEVYYDCVILGFRGMYASGTLQHQHAGSHTWPETVELWLDRTSRMLLRQEPRRVAPQPRRPIQGYPPGNSRVQVMWWSAVAVLLLLSHGVLFHFLQTTR